MRSGVHVRDRAFEDKLDSRKYIDEVMTCPILTESDFTSLISEDRIQHFLMCFTLR